MATSCPPTRGAASYAHFLHYRPRLLRRYAAILARPSMAALLHTPRNIWTSPEWKLCREKLDPPPVTVPPSEATHNNKIQRRNISAQVSTGDSRPDCIWGLSRA